MTCAARQRHRFGAYETLPIRSKRRCSTTTIVDEANAPDRVLLAVADRDLAYRFAATCAAGEDRARRH